MPSAAPVVASHYRALYGRPRIGFLYFFCFGRGPCFGLARVATLGCVAAPAQDYLESAARSDDGRNVVIHEFAHQLDQENGVANGAPPPSLGVGGTARHSAQRWSQVFHVAYAQLQAQAHTGVQGLLSHYGAQDPAEFFAVVSETFFEQGAALLAQYPALYAELAGFYQVDSAAW